MGTLTCKRVTSTSTDETQKLKVEKQLESQEEIVDTNVSLSVY